MSDCESTPTQNAACGCGVVAKESGCYICRPVSDSESLMSDTPLRVVESGSSNVTIEPCWHNWQRIEDENGVYVCDCCLICDLIEERDV